jgi:hypothetical protein
MAYTDAHAEIEAAVARGYGLGREHLETIYSADLTDRRGFWRHFAGDPHATTIAESAVELVGARAVAGTSRAATI